MGGVNNRSAQNNRGFSLVEMLVAVGIMGGVVTQMNFSMSSQIKMARKIEYDMDIEVMRLSLLSRVDCQNTCGLSGSGCPGGGVPVNLRDRRNTVISPSFGRWQITASSTNAGIMALARHEVNGVVSKDPVNEKLIQNIPVIDASFSLCGKRTVQSNQVECPDPDTIIVGVDFSKATPEAVCKKAESQNIDTVEANRLETMHLQSPSVTGGKISTATDINKLGTSRLALNAVVSGKLASSSVTSAKVLAGTVVNADFALNSISEGKIVGNNIVGGHLKANLVTSANINASAIETRHFQDGAVTAAKIKLNSVGNSQIKDSEITSPKIEDGTFVGGDIEGNSLSSDHIRNDAINNSSLIGSDISAYKIAVGQIISDKIDNNSITSAKIVNGTIWGQDKIADKQITLAKLAPCAEGDFYVYQDDVSGGWKCEDPTSNIEIASATLVLKTDGAGNALAPSVIDANPAGIWNIYGNATSGVNIPTFPAYIGNSHGIQCGDPSITDTNDPRGGWAMLSCMPADNQTLVSAGLDDAADGTNDPDRKTLRRYVNNHNYVRDTLFFDRDIYVEGSFTNDASKKDATCWTNDFEQVRSAKASAWVDGPIVKNYELNLHVICIRYKKN